MAENIVQKIVERRLKDAKVRGFNFGFKIPENRTRPINTFMANPGVILEVKRASPSKGDIAPNLNAVETAKKYAENGAGAISCLTEENYFKGSLKDLMDICNALPNVPILRKDFLVNEEEIEIAFRCGADAVLLISGILSVEQLLKMAAKCKSLGIRALLEVRTMEDVQKALRLKQDFADTIVCGVNSRNLVDFSVDLLVPAMLKKQLGGAVIFESGITTAEAAKTVSSMGFTGILLGEFAARNPSSVGKFIEAFKNGGENSVGKKLIELAEKVNDSKKRPMVKICGLTREEDVLLADSLGADFLGFIFAPGFERNVFGKRFSKLENCLKSVKAFKVGVITDPKNEESKAAVQFVKNGVLDFVQIHGVKYKDTPQYLLEVPHYFALTNKNGISDEECAELFKFGEPRFLQDSRSHIYGSAESNGKLSHLWLAGGVTAENVKDLVEKFQPELIDVSSGIESETVGEKDHSKLKKFFEELK